MNPDDLADKPSPTDNSSLPTKRSVVPLLVFGGLGWFLFIASLVVILPNLFAQGGPAILGLAAESPTTNESSSDTIFRVDGGLMEQPPLAVSGYEHAIRLVGSQHSTCIPQSNGSCSTYAFNFDEDVSVMRVIDPEGTIASISLKPFIENLTVLAKEKLNDPNGVSTYSHENLSFAFENDQIRLKFYFDEVRLRKVNDQQLLLFSGLVLFSPTAYSHTYTYSQHAEPDETWIYHLFTNESKLGRLTINGFQTQTSLSVEKKISSNGSVDILFIAYDDLFPLKDVELSKGDRLFSLTPQGKNYSIRWDKLKPQINTNQGAAVFELNPDV